MFNVFLFFLSFSFFSSRSVCYFSLRFAHRLLKPKNGALCCLELDLDLSISLKTVQLLSTYDIVISLFVCFALWFENEHGQIPLRHSPAKYFDL